MLTPLQRYQSDIQKRKIKTDDSQWEAVQFTQRVYSELNIAEQTQHRFFEKIFKAKNTLVKGL